MTQSGIRAGQAGLCAIIVILAILVCCSTPTARNLNFVANLRSSSTAADPNSNFQGLVLGIRGFCNKNKCLSYSAYAGNPSKGAAKMGLNANQARAVRLLSGTGASTSGKRWYDLNILTIIATTASVFAFILSGLLLTLTKQSERSQSPINTGMLKMAFLGFLVISFVLNVATWGYAMSVFNDAKTQLQKQKAAGSWGPAFWVSLFTWLLGLLALGCEALARKGERGAGNRGYDSQDPYGNGSQQGYDPGYA